VFPVTHPPSSELGAAASPDRIRNARDVLRSAWPSEAGPADEGAVRLVLAVAGLESGYGVGFGDGVNNWGAIQCGHGPPCGDTCIPWGDKHSDGTGYQYCFKKYASPAAGARDLVSLLARKVGPGVLSTGNPDVLASAMYDAHYYEGYGNTREERVSGYAKGLKNRLAEVGSALGPAQSSASTQGRSYAPLFLGSVALGLLIAKRRRRG
jgi:hypothetical protein